MSKREGLNRKASLINIGMTSNLYPKDLFKKKSSLTNWKTCYGVPSYDRTFGSKSLGGIILDISTPIVFCYRVEYFVKERYLQLCVPSIHFKLITILLLLGYFED